MHLSRLMRLTAAVAILAAPGTLRATSKGGIKGIDIIVKKVPTGHAIPVQIGAGGTVRFEFAETGRYTVEAVAKPDAPAGSLSIELGGSFTRKTPGAGNPVTGKNMDGNTLFAAGSTNGDRKTLLSVPIDVTAPVAFVGMLRADPDISISARHVTFYSVVGGPVAPAQTVTIFNGSTSTISYTAAFEVAGATPWTVDLSKSSGSIGPGQTDSINVRPQPGAAGFPAGTDNGFLRIKYQTAIGVQESVAAVTLFVQPGASAKGTLLVNPLMAAVYPVSAGRFEPATFTITNNSAEAQIYTSRVEDGITLQPAQFPLNPSQSMTVTAQTVAAGQPDGRWVRTCFWLKGKDGTEHRVCVWYWHGTALGVGCTPTRLYPLVTGMNPPVARAGFPLDVKFQVYDDCGGQLDAYTAMMSVNNGAAESHIAAVQTNNRAVTYKGISGYSLSRAALADAPELQINGYLYPYFTVGPDGLTLQIEVEASNPPGGVPLTGLVEMPLEYDADANAPLVAQQAFVSNASFEPVPLTPNSVFSLFAVVPGLPGEDAGGLPFRDTLSGVQVLIDGKRNVPLIYAHSGLVQGIVPYDIADGTHIVNILYNGQMSGAITFEVARAGAAPLIADEKHHAHLYDDLGRLITKDNPAEAGKPYVFYGADYGRVIGPELVAGALSPPILLPAEQECKVTIGGNPAKLFYCGLSGGSVVLYQTNFTMDSITAANASPGDVVELPIVQDQAGYSGSTSALGWFKVIQVQSTINISVQATYPNAQFNVNGNLITGNTGLLTFNSGTPIPLDVPADPQTPSAGTRYYFAGWSQSGNRAQTIAPTTNSAYAAYFLASYLLTINGTATVKPPGYFNNGNPSTDGYYTQTPSVFIPVTITGFCPGGTAATGLLVNGATLPNPTTITMDKPTTVTVQCSAPAAASVCVAAPPGMLGWFPLDETSGNSAANILGPSTSNGTFQGSLAFATGKVGGAKNFNGSGWIAINDPNAFNVTTGSFSVDAWVRAGAGFSPLRQGIVEKHDPSKVNREGYYVFVENGRLGLHMHDGPASLTEFLSPPGSALLQDGAWHHIAVSVGRTANSGTFYFDGVAVATFDPSLRPMSLSNGEKLTIGRIVNLNQNFSGLIDEVEIFNRALPLAEVQAIYAADKFGKCKPATTSYPVTISGCNATLGPVSLQTSTGTWGANSSLTVSAAVPTGGLVNVKVTIGSVTTVYTSVPFTFNLTGPATIVADCPTKPATCVAAPAGLVGWYPLDETSGPVNDLATNPVTLTPGPLNFPDPLGKVNGGWRILNGGFVSSASAAKYNFGAGDFAVDAWLKFIGGQSLISLVSKTNFTGSITGFNVQLDNGVLRLDLGSNGATVTTWKGTKDVINDKLWHHFVVNVSRTSGVTFFVDGKIDPLTANPLMSNFTGSISNTEPLRLGGVEMTLDEVEIFNRTLTAAEAQTLYLADSLGKCKSCPGAPNDAVASYHMESNVDPIVDSKGGFNGKVVTPSFNANYSLTGTLNPETHAGYGNAVKFPLASRPAVLLNGNPVNPSTQDVTFTTYVKLDPADSTSGHHDAIWSQYWYAAPGAFYTLQLDATSSTSTMEQMQFAISDGNQGTSGNNLWLGPKVPRDNQWHCIGFRLHHLPDGTGEVQMFMDGTFGGVMTTNALIPLSSAQGASATFFGWAGYNTSTDDTRFAGSLDEVQIFNRKLSDDEVKSNCGICSGQGPAATFPVTVNTSPPSIGATLGLAPSTPGLATNVYIASVPAGSYSASVSPTIVTGSTTEYRLKPTSTWSLNGTPNAAWNNLTTTNPATNLTAAATFTANFDTYYKVTVTLNGCIGQNRGVALTTDSAFVLAGSTFSATILPGPGRPIQTVTLNPGGIQKISNGTVTIAAPVNGPITITADCPVQFNVTVNTSPLNIGATVGVTPSTPGTALNVYTASVTAGNYQATVSPTTITGSTTEYRLKPTSTWSLNGTPNAAWNNLTTTVATNLTATSTFTANFDTYYKVTLTLSGCTNENTAGITDTGGSAFVLAGTSFNTSIIAAGAHNSILTATLDGIAQKVPNGGLLIINVNPLNGPQTITATCGPP